jgi:D-amino-acid oxidase
VTDRSQTGVVVVGGGVIGLTCALELARAGRTVTVLAQRPAHETVSAVAAALWFPYAAAPPERVLGWAGTTLRAFSALAADPATGVVLREGVVCHRHDAPDIDWTAQVPGHRPARADELPAGIAHGTACTLPVVEMDAYLRWLAAQAAGAGVRFAPPRRLASLDDVHAATVVVATGLGARELLGDAELTPVRGQVVRVRNPGLRTWLLDDDHPDGMTYIVARGDDVVLGGTADPGAEDVTPDPAVEAAILERARGLVPALRDAPVVSRGAGLRPGRTAVRLEREDRDGRTVVHCYGHGGAGVTLSWGCAAEVAALVAGVPACARP